MSTTTVKQFDKNNLNFWARLVIFFLGLLTVIGVKLPESPEALGEQITTTISTSGFYAVLGIIAVSLLMPIYNLIRTKPKITAASVFGSPNFWIYLGSFVAGILILVGINIPEGTASEVVSAIYAKDWTLLTTLILTNILDPVIRWFADKRKTQVAQHAANLLK